MNRTTEPEGLDAWSSAIWGKSRLAPDGRREFHPLADHCTDVATVFQQLLTLPRLRRALQSCTSTLLDETHSARLALIAFLHDIGKCNRGFQALADPDAMDTGGHRLEAMALLLDPALCLQWPPEWLALLGSMQAWFAGDEVERDETLSQMLIASLSHHGRPLSKNDWDFANKVPLVSCWHAQGRAKPLRALAALCNAATTRFLPTAQMPAQPLQVNARFQQRFAGLVMLADWIASDTQFFEYRASAEEDRPQLAKRAAQHALQAIGLQAPTTRRPRAFVEVFGFSPSPLQLHFDKGDAHAGLLQLAESDTGSGKTEAALACFLRLYRQGEVDGLFFALPTRVAARELYERVRKAIETAFDANDRPGPVLLAAPGYAKVDGKLPQLVNPQGVLWDESDPMARAERQWVAAHPKRFLAAPVAVGTLDQALLAVLQTKHALMRSVCLDRHLLVVDEVHASDPYMSQLLRQLLDGHRARGGHALLLSATLGEAARAAYFGRDLLPVAQSQELPYPAVTDAQGLHALPSTGRSKRVRVQQLQDLSETALLPALLQALQEGARVLVVCNTVARANALMRAVEADSGFRPNWLFQVQEQVCPHHGRFARAHRELMDAAVSQRLGKGSPDGPLLLVGTQTLEQSLDIDADWLISDACPVDVLLQRIGRLHRHERAHRPARFRQAQLLLRVPEGGELSRYLSASGDRFHGPLGIGKVYADARVVQRSLELLAAQPDIELPRDNRRLVEQATHPDALAQLADPRWARYLWEVIGRECEQQRLAMAAALEDLPFGDLQYRDRDGDRHIRTRLGAEALALRLLDAPAQPFGIALDELAIPQHLLPSGAGPWPEAVVAHPIEQGLRFELGPQAYRYTRFGLEKEDAAHA